jgi:hypothetical protein
MVEQIVAREIKNHKHITPEDARWYLDTVHALELDHKSVDDLMWPPSRWRADRIHGKWSECPACYDVYSEAAKPNSP